MSSNNHPPCAEEDLSKRDSLIGECRQYVATIASRMVRFMGLSSSMYDELVAAGFLGLVEAAGRYDFSSQAAFKTFAFLRIRGAMIDAIRQTAHLSGRAYRYAKALSAAQELREQMLHEYKHHGSHHPAEKLSNILDYLAKGVTAFRLSMSDAEDELNQQSELMPTPEQEISHKQVKRKLWQLVETLPEKERYIITQHYYYGRSFVEIASESDGMSKSWVSRLHARALDRLKEAAIQDDIALEAFPKRSSAC
ncbi:MAG: sigma-70 family RNA polymerase sigma factor [Deltaproteobacteria bacterium]|nr:sigma-70 family RNA polymerase sigma factor [Deltaproteobacteria bacterium]